MEAVKQLSANIVLAGFLISFISRTASDGLRVILLGVSDSQTRETLETTLTVLVFVITGSLSTKSLVIFYFIFELLVLRVKLEAGEISDYNLQMRGLKLKKKMALIAFATIEAVILVLIGLNQKDKESSLLIVDLFMRACNILLYAYMFMLFVELITFFEKKKKDKLRL